MFLTKLLEFFSISQLLCLHILLILFCKTNLRNTPLPSPLCVGLQRWSCSKLAAVRMCKDKDFAVLCYLVGFWWSVGAKKSREEWLICTKTWLGDERRAALLGSPNAHLPSPSHLLFCRSEKFCHFPFLLKAVRWRIAFFAILQH